MSTRMALFPRSDRHDPSVRDTPAIFLPHIVPQGSTRAAPPLPGRKSAFGHRAWAVARGTLAIMVALLVSACASESATGLDPDPTGEGEEPQVATIEVTPSHLDLEVGDSQQLEAVALDAEGNTLPRELSDFSWSSSNGSVSVNPSGVVTAVSDGTAMITAALSGRSAQSHIVSNGGDDNGEPSEELPDYGEWDFILEDTLVVGNVLVPEDEVWLFGSDVQVEGNVLVDGALAMRPGSTLKFLGANPDEYVGGGMHYGPEFSRDIGLWVGVTGVLDIQGTPKQGWNRTGTHASWNAGDEYWISPTARGDYEPRRWYPGDLIPQVDPRVPAAEVINVTRDIVIEGPGHIHIHAHRPQRIEYVQLRNMGVSAASHDGEVLGRYALHLHHGADASRGTIIRGVSAISSQGRVFVPHGAHGITMTDNVSVNSYAQALWWDEGDLTHDILVDGFAATGVYMPPSIGGGGHEIATLGSGENKTMRNVALSGARGGRSVGFHWNTKDGHRLENTPLWRFTEGNVAHNNEGFGIRFWFNDRWAHHVQNAVTYRNGQGGIENGAYRNGIRYSNVLLIDEGHEATAVGHRPPVAIHHNSNSATREDDGGPSRYTNVVMVSPEGAAFEVGNRNLDAKAYLEIIDSSLESGPGSPKVYVKDGKNAWLAHFIRSGVTPDDFEFETLTGGNDGTHILIDHEDGRKWEIRVENGQKIVNAL